MRGQGSGAPPPEDWQARALALAREVLELQQEPARPSRAGAGLRITLDFALSDPPTVEALTAFRAYLAGMVKHQDAGTVVGVRDLERAGIAAPVLVGAVVEGLGQLAGGARRRSKPRS